MTNKIRTISIREYVTQLKRPGFWWMTFGLPLFIIVIAVLVVGISAFAAYRAFGDDDDEPEVVGVVDHAGIVDLREVNAPPKPSTMDKEDFDKVARLLKLSPSLRNLIKRTIPTPAPDDQVERQRRDRQYRAFVNREDATQALNQEEIRGFVEIAQDFRSSFAITKVETSPDDHGFSVAELERHVRNQLLVELTQSDRAPMLIEPFRDIEQQYLNPPQPEDQKAALIEKVRKYVLPLMLIITMMIATLNSTDRLLRGLMEEKENRVIEVLLSSASANQLMAGKVIGLGLVGLTQLLIWEIGMIWPASRFVGILHIDLATILVFLIFFVAGYFLLATFIVSFGSLGNNFQEASQWSLIWILLSLTPMFILPALLGTPDGLIAKIFTYFPLTAPLAVVARMGADAIAAWEIAGSFIVLVLALYVALRLGAKVFRIGILMTGKSLNPLDLWRAWRQS